MSARKLYAVFYFCNDYHSGQWTRGYKLMCLAQRLLMRRGIGGIILAKSWIRKTSEYKTLVKNHKDKI